MKTKIIHFIKKYFGWFLRMSELSRLRLYTDLLIIPGMIIFITYAVSGKVLNMYLTYGIVDFIIIIESMIYVRYREERKRIEEEAENSELEWEYIRRKIEQLGDSTKN